MGTTDNSEWKLPPRFAAYMKDSQYEKGQGRHSDFSIKYPFLFSFSWKEEKVARVKTLEVKNVIVLYYQVKSPIFPFFALLLATGTLGI